MRENFGKPHIIAKAHIKKLENLPPIKQADGQSLLEFAGHLDVAERPLTGMGPEYLSDLKHTNTLRELNRKLLLFMRVKWTACAGRIIESGQRPRISLRSRKCRAKCEAISKLFFSEVRRSFPKISRYFLSQTSVLPKSANFNLSH